MLDTLPYCCTTPKKRETNKLIIVDVQDTKLSGFVFKIHSNLDPKHRDRIAFYEYVAAGLKRNKYFHHVRLNKDVGLATPIHFGSEKV